MSDHDPFSGQPIQTKNVLIRRPLLNGQVQPEKTTSAVHIGVFDGLIETAHYCPNLSIWYASWQKVGTDYRSEMKITPRVLPSEPDIINTAVFLEQMREQVLQKFHAYEMDAVQQRLGQKLWDTKELVNIKTGAAQSIDNQKWNTSGQVASQQYNAAQQSQNTLTQQRMNDIVSKMFDDALDMMKVPAEQVAKTGNAIFKINVDAIGAPKVMIYNPDRLCRVDPYNEYLNINDPGDGTAPIPRPAEVIEPSLMSKKLQEW